jgi:hypothetical protein
VALTLVLISVGLLYTGLRLWNKLEKQVGARLGCPVGAVHVASLPDDAPAAECTCCSSVVFDNAFASHCALALSRFPWHQRGLYEAWLERTRETPAQGLPMLPSMFTTGPGDGPTLTVDPGRGVGRGQVGVSLAFVSLAPPSLSFSLLSLFVTQHGPW